MMAYLIKFSIDGYDQEYLVIADNEENAVNYFKDNYLGEEFDSVKIKSIEERTIVDTDLSF